MSEPMEPHKYYEYFYTWNMANARLKKWNKNGRKTIHQPMLNSDPINPKKWVIWHQRETDNKVLPTTNARVYDK